MTMLSLSLLRLDALARTVAPRPCAGASVLRLIAATRAAPSQYAALAVLLVLGVLCGSGSAAEVLIHERASRYNTILVTEDEEGVRRLRFERRGATQSAVRPDDPGHLELSYTRSMLAGLALIEAPSRILIVGLGGGALPRFLRLHYPDSRIDIAELDPDVVEVAEHYFGFRPDARMRVAVADGRDFIEAARERYDLILLDAYGAREVPPRLTTIEFLRAVRARLEPHGVVVANLVDQRGNPLYESMLRTYLEAFAALYVLDVRAAANRIALATPSDARWTQAQLAARARALGVANGFRFDLGRLVEHGFRQIREVRSGAVLRDRPAPEHSPQALSGDGRLNAKWCASVRRHVPCVSRSPSARPT